jgi:uncharacterized protein
MIARLVSKKILEDAQYFPVLSIIGPRQVGKTTLAKSLQSQLGKETIYLDLEYDEDARLLEQPTRFLQQNVEKCVIIDEVQRAPQLFTLLRALVDQQRTPSRFLLLGSASPWLLRNSSESLAGRIAYTELTPLSLLELPSETANIQHWFRGGFPDAFLAPSDAVCGRWLENLVKTFIERDVRLLGYELAPNALSRLITVLTSIHGNLLNISDLSRTLGISHATINHYLDILEGAFLISRLQPYHINITKRLVKSPKLYFRDSGILHRIANISSSDGLLKHILSGASWEGYVIEEIRRQTFQRWEYYFYRTYTGAEVDLILIAPNGKKAVIEIKSSNAPTVTKGFYEASTDIAADFQYIITPDSRNYHRDDNVHVVPLRDFLSQEIGKIEI